MNHTTPPLGLEALRLKKERKILGKQPKILTPAVKENQTRMRDENGVEWGT